MQSTEKQLQKQRIEAKMFEVSARRRDQEPLRIENAPDPTDQIQAAVERDLLVGLLNQDARLREDLRRAYALIQEGDYGICEDCDEAIAPSRLKAIPWARCCVRCQATRDRQVNETDVFPKFAA